MTTHISPKRILIMMSNTGGGHKTAAQAIADALVAKYQNGVVVEVIDFVKEYAPQPFDRAAEMYQLMIRVPYAWRSVYEIGDGIRRSRVLNTSFAFYGRRGAKRFLNNHPADVIISTYHLANSTVFEAMSRNGLTTPFITVVTDLVTVPPVWFDNRATLFITPTKIAAELAADAGIDPGKIRVLGMPVSSKFKPATKPKAELKEALGWKPNRPAILVMAGAEGIGPLEQIAEGLATLKATIVVITGKNTGLYEKLSSEKQPANVVVCGFVTNMPEMMRAADILVSKAGAGTVTEALNTHLPQVIYAKLSGQEDGNVDLVTQNGAGVWQPQIPMLADTIKTLFDNPATLPAMAEAAASLAQPKAAADIAAVVGELLP